MQQSTFRLAGVIANQADLSPEEWIAAGQLELDEIIRSDEPGAGERACRLAGDLLGLLVTAWRDGGIDDPAMWLVRQELALHHPEPG